VLYFVRIGSLADIFSATGPSGLIGGRRVIVRTARGVELGEVVRQRTPVGDATAEVTILRSTTDPDELMIRRLLRHRRRAVNKCRQELAHAGSKSILLDVDQLFDGGTLVMQFLGPVDEIAQSISESIVAEYESVAKTREFARLLSEGCGPDCGTAEGGGCGTSCGSCSLSGACKTSTMRSGTA
jgi:cell fate regulator YaaT (PSP1 superfamily)